MKKSQEKTKLEDTSAIELEETQSEAAAGGLIVEEQGGYGIYSDDGMHQLGYVYKGTKNPNALDEAKKLARQKGVSDRIISYAKWRDIKEKGS